MTVWLRVLPWALYGSAALVKVGVPHTLTPLLTMLAPPKTAVLLRKHEANHVARLQALAWVVRERVWAASPLILSDRICAHAGSKTANECTKDVPRTSNALTVLLVSGCMVTSGTEPGEELLTKRELAARLKKTPRCIEQWMRRHYLPYIKIGHTVRFRWCDILEALEHLTIR